MSVKDIFAEIDSEISRLQQVRAILAGHSRAKRTRKKRILSAEARKRISDAQRKRWAKQKAGKS